MTYKRIILAWFAVQTAVGLLGGAWFALLHPMCRFDLLEAYRNFGTWEFAMRTCRLVDSDNIWWTELIQEYLL